MFRKTIAAVFAASLIFAAAPSFASTEGDAEAHVYLEVLPHVAVFPILYSIDGGAIQFGEHSIRVNWRIEANVQHLTVWGAATHLYKADLVGVVPPIPLDLPKGIEVIDPVAESGATGVFSPNNGDDWILEYDDTIPNYPINSLGGRKTVGTEFQSSAIGHFSHDFDFDVFWNLVATEQPQGEYSGFVMIFVSLL